MSEPKDRDAAPGGDDVVVQPLPTDEGVEAPVVRAATAADEAALPVVEVVPPPAAAPAAAEAKETAPAPAPAAPAAPDELDGPLPAPEQHVVERSNIIEMKSPDNPEFSLLERSVLIAAPVDETAPFEEDPLAGLTRTQRALRWLSPRLLGGVLLLLGGAGVAGTFVTLLNPFRDWFMHLLMYTVIFAFYLLYLKAHARRRRVWRYVMMFVTVALSGYFAWILTGYVPAQKVWYARSVLWRDEMSLLWLPIGLLAGSAVLLLLHCLFVARHAARPRPTS